MASAMHQPAGGSSHGVQTTGTLRDGHHGQQAVWAPSKVSEAQQRWGRGGRRLGDRADHEVSAA